MYGGRDLAKKINNGAVDAPSKQKRKKKERKKTIISDYGTGTD